MFQLETQSMNSEICNRNMHARDSKLKYKVILSILNIEARLNVSSSNCWFYRIVKNHSCDGHLAVRRVHWQGFMPSKSHLGLSTLSKPDTDRAIHWPTRPLQE